SVIQDLPIPSKTNLVNISECINPNVKCFVGNSCVDGKFKPIGCSHMSLVPVPTPITPDAISCDLAAKINLGNPSAW
ncbi:hypothetical protein PMAYCL1PPCAC_24687, partial [Pristionchus mayeri]